MIKVVLKAAFSPYPTLLKFGIRLESSKLKNEEATYENAQSCCAIGEGRKVDCPLHCMIIVDLTIVLVRTVFIFFRAEEF